MQALAYHSGLFPHSYCGHTEITPPSLMMHPCLSQASMPFWYTWPSTERLPISLYFHLANFHSSFWIQLESLPLKIFFFFFSLSTTTISYRGLNSFHLQNILYIILLIVSITLNCSFMHQSLSAITLTRKTRVHLYLPNTGTEPGMHYRPSVNICQVSKINVVYTSN